MILATKVTTRRRGADWQGNCVPFVRSISKSSDVIFGEKVDSRNAASPCSNNGGLRRSDR